MARFSSFLEGALRTGHASSRGFYLESRLVMISWVILQQQTDFPVPVAAYDNIFLCSSWVVRDSAPNGDLELQAVDTPVSCNHVLPEHAVSSVIRTGKKMRMTPQIIHVWTELTWGG